MSLGGVTYQNIPFNGWFVSTEIVRNLMVRYNVGPSVSGILRVDTTTIDSWRYLVANEIRIQCMLLLVGSRGGLQACT